MGVVEVNRLRALAQDEEDGHVIGRVRVAGEADHEPGHRQFLARDDRATRVRLHPRVSARVDQTASKFEEIIDLMIQSADIETRLRRLGEELQKTNRRVNALENTVIPELTEQVKFIFSSLDERAREDHFRLKKVKKKILQRQGKA